VTRRAGVAASGRSTVGTDEIRAALHGAYEHGYPEAKMTRLKLSEPGPTQLELLAAVIDAYQDQEVVVGVEAPPLCTSCPANEPCWARIRAKRPKAEPRLEDGGIALPWIGPDYRPGGVGMVAINRRRDALAAGGRTGGSYDEFRVTREQLSGLAKGQRRIHRSNFIWGATAVLAMVLHSVRGQTPPARIGADGRIEALNATARLQAVKCSPLHQFQPRSSPTPEMVRHCPPRYLENEIKTLRPSVLVCFGKPPRDALIAFGAMGLDSARNVRRGRITVAGSEIDLFAVPHPSAFGRFKEARKELGAELYRRPAGTADDLLCRR
jgi:Uracil DNA glycosylase superfamily